ncbi:hypothetical protein ACN47A_12925 [Myxococcus fulvus]|uniref:hypothetical protein n=1 Tax=Myxococcus fulvus TaxID=33 RepID=UPI003B9B4D9B
MKRYGWMVVLLLAGGCGSRHHGPTVHERRAAIRADHERKYGGEGFQATHWGMTRAQVRALYPEALATAREDLVVATTLGERPARVFFLFAGDKLGSVFVRFATPEVLREEHQQMVEVLTAKYGRPRKRGSSRRVLKYRESIDLAWLLTKTSPPAAVWEPARRGSALGTSEAPAEATSSPPLVEASGTVTLSPPVEAVGAPPLVAVEGPRAEVAGEQDAVDEAPPPLVEAQVDDDDRPDAYDTEEEPSPPEPEIRASRNGYVVVARWKAPETAVRLLGYQVARDRLLTLLYESDAYGEEIREEMEGRLAAELRKQARDF